MRSPSVFYVGFLQQRGLMSMGDYPNFFQSNTKNPDCQGVMVPTGGGLPSSYEKHPVSISFRLHYSLGSIGSHNS